MSITEAQRDMRFAYFNGATGAVTSATAWLIAALVASFVSSTTGIVALIIGGMLIFPVSVLLCKAAGRPGKHSKGNPLAPLAIEGTIWMVISIPIAVGAAFHQAEWFFPAMLLVIGGRYFSFATLYGLRIYWAFGATLALAAVALLVLEAPVMSGAYTGALIEYAFGIALFKIKPALQLEKLKLEEMASGGESLLLTTQVGYAAFPAYASAIVKLLDAQVTSRASTPAEALWEVTIQGAPFRLVFEDFPMGVTLEPQDEPGSKLIRGIRETLLQHRISTKTKNSIAR